MSMNYKESIIKFCENLGLDTIGFTRLKRFDELHEFLESRRQDGLENEFEIEDIESRINPMLYMEEGKTIISIAFPYLFSKEISRDIYFSKYTRGGDYHKVVSMYLKRICEYIESIGGRSKYFVDSNALPERYIAHLCGIGFLGKNNMIITKKYGSYVFLGEIITDLSIEEDTPIKCGCNECDLCIKACPTKCINKEKTNPNICLSYITQKKHIEDEWFDKINGRIFGCDTCQDLCPFNRYAELSNINEFKPFEYMQSINEYEILNLNNKAFKAKYASTSSGWRGKNILTRNTMIHLMKNRKYKGPISFNSPYLEDYYCRLLKHFKL